MRWGVVGDWAGSGDPAQVQQAHQIEGQCVPECGGLRLFQAADSERVQAAVAAFGVGELGDRRALFGKLGFPPFVLKIVFCERYGASRRLFSPRPAASAQWHLLYRSGNALAAGERGKDLQIRHRRLAPCRSQI